MTAPAPMVFPLAGLLSEPPGTERRYDIHGVTIPLPDGLRLAEPIDGRLRVTRTNRGVLVDGELTTALAEQCSRCLRDTKTPVNLALHEEVLPTIDISSGRALDRDSEPEVARLTDHHEFDFAALAAEALSLNEPLAPLCEPDCPGLCTTCGERLGREHAPHPDDDIDPRLAALQAFRVDGEGESE